jgi:hypothetical protein
LKLFDSPTGSRGNRPIQLIILPKQNGIHWMALTYFVRSLELLSRAFHLTTGTFNLIVKDPMPLRLSVGFWTTTFHSMRPEGCIA